MEKRGDIYVDSIAFNLTPDRQVKSTSYMLWANIIVFFENRGPHKVAIRTVKVMLVRKTSRGGEKLIKGFQRLPIEVTPLGSTPTPATLDGWNVEGITPLVMLKSHFELRGRVGKRLDQNCFFRVSLDAINQPLMDVDLDVDWEKARATGVYVPLTPRSSAQYQVHK